MKKILSIILILCLILTNVVYASELISAKEDIVLKIDRLNYYKPIEFSLKTDNIYSVNLLNKLHDYGKVKLSIESIDGNVVLDDEIYNSNFEVILNEKEYKWELQVTMSDGTTLTYLGNIVDKDGMLDCNILAIDEGNYTLVPVMDDKVISSLEIEPMATTYETEPNNTFAAANTIKDSDDMYGTMYSDRDDYYKITFPEAGNVNFWLGNIPSGKNHDLYVYEGTTLKWSSTSTTGTQELIAEKPVKANTTYYVRVTYPSGTLPTSANYWLRVKMLPSIVFPVDYTSSVNYCYDDCAGYPGHYGVDCKGASGAYIYAFADGVVTAAVDMHYSYGNYIDIRHDDKFGNNEYLKTRYAHIKDNSSGNPNFYVSVGDTVQKGDLIALVGNTGESLGAHLHFETLYCDTISGTYARRDPMIYFPNIPCTACAAAAASTLNINDNLDMMRSVGIMINDAFIDIESLTSMTPTELDKYGITSKDLSTFSTMIEKDDEFSLFHNEIDSLIK
ncbi:Peptidase family M23 [anaerobic digester metagenome]